MVKLLKKTSNEFIIIYNMFTMPIPMCTKHIGRVQSQAMSF